MKFGYSFNEQEKEKIASYICNCDTELSWGEILEHSGKKNCGKGCMDSFGIESLEDFMFVCVPDETIQIQLYNKLIHVYVEQYKYEINNNMK